MSHQKHPFTRLRLSLSIITLFVDSKVGCSSPVDCQIVELGKCKDQWIMMLRSPRRYMVN